jgi:hypothetical protein
VKKTIVRTRVSRGSRASSAGSRMADALNLRAP